jgi:hypothetical protein
MCSNDSIVVDVPAPDEPVTAMIGFRDDIVDTLRSGVKCYTEYYECGQVLLINSDYGNYKNKNGAEAPFLILKYI